LNAARVVLALVLVFAARVFAQEQQPTGDEALQAWASAALAIKPTVTKEMGDVGGKSFGKPYDPAKTRRYYIAAEVDVWDFAPERRDPVCGKPLPPQVVAQPTAMKLRYIQYADATFTTKLLQNSRLGVLGPVLRGVVGETLAVTFLNRTQYPLSMHPHGVKYDKDSEGAYHVPEANGLGSAVGPGAQFTYVWHLDESSGPLPNEPSSKGWLYHSHVTGDAESNLGLIGFIVVTDPKRARPDGTPNDVDREMASLFMIFNESGLSEEEEEAAEMAAIGGFDLPPPRTWAQIEEQRELSSRFAINGCIFGNLHGLEMNEGERVRWYLFGLGDENDNHTAHWHGLRVIEEARHRTDVVELLPASMKVADMVADNPGSWLFHCHVAEHMQEGMFARVIVRPKAGPSVNRTPVVAFFGMREGEQSMRIDRAEATLDLRPAAPRPCTIYLHGFVTVSDAFSVFASPVRLRLGGKSVTLAPDRTGQATAAGDGVTYRILNSGQYGVVYGGTMEFEATLAAPAWLDELKKLGIGGPGAWAVELPTPIELKIGEATHKSAPRLPITRR
jgi:manganese oxidase